MDKVTTSNKANLSGAERRAHVRYPISATADVMIEGIGRHKAIARDFCLGGLLLDIQTDNLLPKDKSLENSLCLVTVNLNNEDFRLRGRIARADKEIIGVAFINPDQQALEALQQHAKVDAQPVSQSKKTESAAIDDKKAATGNSGHADPAKLIKLLNICNAKTKTYIEPMMSQFMTAINNSLFEGTKAETDINIQNKYFKALEIINNNKHLCITSFSNAINTVLDTNDTLAIFEEEETSDVNDSTSLALVTDEEFDVWLATSKVINKIETEFPQQLSALEKRLSHVYGQPVDRRNNPFGPPLFVNGFQTMLDNMELDNIIKIACYDTFRNIFVTIAQKLYDDLNNILIANDILPKLKHVITHARNNPPKKENENTSSVTDEDENTVNEKKQDDHRTKAILPASDKHEHPGNRTSIPQQSLYDLVGEIRNLQQELRTSAHTGDASTMLSGSVTGAATNTNALPAYSTAEVLDVITKINLPVKTVTGDGKSIAEFRRKLEEKIENDSSSENSKNLSLQQGRIIDVTENVFTSLLNDLQVAQSVRPWLEQLAVPVMKMALLDENLFTDKNHVVRNVINKLAELEVLASADDAEEQAAVRQAFSWVINLVNKEFDGTASVYNRAAQQLDLLINVQKNSFEKNIKQVIAEAIQEEKNKATSEAESSDDQNDQWLRMVRRLKENHWVLFDADTNEAKRLKVAWIAPRKGKYIFVNVMGRKDRITTDSGLADEFKNGSAVVLDGGDDPAMDRAQYSMLQKLHQQLLFQSSHDELTGLINRREFLTCMQHAVEDAKQSKNKHAICYIDIDNFKVFNSNYGYEAGDKLLLDIIALVKNKLEDDNVLARIGADQFGLLLQKTSMDDAVELMEDIMDQLVDYRFEWNDNRMSVTTSTGITIVNANTNNAENLLQSAESSCGLAKESGGNQIQIASAGSNRLSRRQKDMEWASKIDKALDENALFLRCQKILPIQSHLEELPHYEILLGISDELGGNASLGDFIQAAEQHNRMPAVDRWVIKTAFNWLANNEDMVSDVSGFTINLSGQSLNNEQLIEFIYDQVNKTSVPIEKICFEVTETAGVSSLSDTSDFIETIKGTGCKFALDDFGTGMSSYSYLKSLPVDYLKIDGIFIKDILNNKNDYAVVKSVCEIGHFMDKLVIAEFVQDQQSADILREIGVDYVQGFGIAKPHKLDDLLR